MMSALGTGIGSVIAPILRRRTREEWILAGALVVPSIPLVLAAHSFGRPALVIAAAAIAAASATGRLAFDSLLQRDGPDAARGRVRAVRDALPARVGPRRCPRGHLSQRRPVGHLPGRARAVVRRALVRRRGSGVPGRGRRAPADADPSHAERSAGGIRENGSRPRAVRVERAHAARRPTDHRRRAADDARGRPARLRRPAAHARAVRQLGDRRARPHAVRVRRRHDGRVHARTRSS